MDPLRVKGDGGGDDNCAGLLRNCSRRFARSCLANPSDRQFLGRLLGNLNGAILPQDVEFPHVFKVRSGEATPELGGEARGQVHQGFLAVGGAVSTLLLVFHDAAADLEIGYCMKRIDATGRGLAVRIYESAALAIGYCCNTRR